MLKTRGTKIIDEKGKEFQLRGINIGGWLMMEGYILGGRNIPESVFKAELAKRYGKKFVLEFSRKFRSSFIRADDIARIKKLGFNCVRLPFNYRLLKEPGGLAYLRKIVRLFAKEKIYVILDMHAVPGSQNDQWHSDSAGKAMFWKEQKYRKKYLALWERLAEIFKNEKWIAGYDIMNEPVTKKVKLLKGVYQQTVDIIRSVGDPHIIFLEGNNWGMDLDFLEEIKGDNLAISAHFYQPIEFTFRWLPDTKYPGTILGKKWNKKELREIIKKCANLAKKVKRPLLVGEFGVASRCACCGREFQWVNDVVDLFEEFGVHWTYWTYKAVRKMSLPDGLFQLTDSTGIIGNEADISGVENFYKILGWRRNEFYRIWKTKNFKLNQFLYDTLKEYLK